MKKVLSVLLAAAMVMGMSVSAFAADYTWTSGTTNKVEGEVNTHVDFHPIAWLSRNGALTTVSTSDDLSLQPGDDLYFQLVTAADNDVNYDGDIDADWSINIKSNGYVDAASFYTYKEASAKKAFGTANYNANLVDTKWVKVEIADEFEATANTTIKFYLYLADNQYKTVTDDVIVECTLSNMMDSNTVSFDFTNDANKYAKWTVEKNKKGTAVFDFSDDVYFTVKMVSEEYVYLNMSQAYDKDIDKEYNEYDADLDFYNFKGDNDSFIKEGELFIPSAKDNKFIYEVVDGELVAVEAEWTDEYKVANVNKKLKGYTFETDELGYYVVADEEMIVAEEEVVEEVETPSTDKANPETGANDFVGAAVALAVVSVAAAGALALKK